MDKCRDHFSSSDTVQSVADAARLLATLHELKELVEQATEGVRSQGKQLVEVLATVTTASDVSPRKGSGELVNVHHFYTYMYTCTCDCVC